MGLTAAERRAESVARAKKPIVYTPAQRERRREQCRERRARIKEYKKKKLEYYHARRANKLIFALYNEWRAENDYFNLENINTILQDGEDLLF